MGAGSLKLIKGERRGLPFLAEHLGRNRTGRADPQIRPTCEAARSRRERSALLAVDRTLLKIIGYEERTTMISRITSFLCSLRSMPETEVEGQGLVEYALIIVFIIIACLVALTGMGDAVMVLWGRVTNELIPSMGG